MSNLFPKLFSYIFSIYVLLYLYAFKLKFLIMDYN